MRAGERFWQGGWACSPSSLGCPLGNNRYLELVYLMQNGGRCFDSNEWKWIRDQKRRSQGRLFHLSVTSSLTMILEQVDTFLYY